METYLRKFNLSFIIYFINIGDTNNEIIKNYLHEISLAY